MKLLKSICLLPLIHLKNVEMAFWTDLASLILEQNQEHTNTKQDFLLHANTTHPLIINTLQLQNNKIRSSVSPIYRF